MSNPNLTVNPAFDIPSVRRSDLPSSGWEEWDEAFDGVESVVAHSAGAFFKKLPAAVQSLLRGNDLSIVAIINTQ